MERHDHIIRKTNWRLINTSGNSLWKHQMNLFHKIWCKCVALSSHWHFPVYVCVRVCGVTMNYNTFCPHTMVSIRIPNQSFNLNELKWLEEEGGCCLIFFWGHWFYLNDNF